MKLNVLNMAGQQVGNVEVSESVFACDYNEALVHQVVVSQLANKRQGTMSALTRTEVRGGGAKPYRQKGTGRARQGSIVAPNYVGGGVVFAPVPRDYSFRINKKEKRAALKSVLTSRVAGGKLIVVDELKMDEIKTKRFKAVMDNLKVEKAMVVIGEQDANVIRSAKNLPTISTAVAENINVYDILKGDTLVITKDAVAKIEEVYA